ncbi:MAG: MarR family winged helix-turn-helix transcriptional regulator [Phycisphaerales bacterium]|nr:MarR family winged helix-turn-helix transcriptional regulator [Phycisphaerales bacterium]
MSNSFTIEDEIVAALRRIIRGVDLHSRHLVHEVGLTWPQLATLRAAERLGECSIKALARAVHLSQPTLTGIVQRLTRSGYVERSRHAQDGRSVNVTITEAGRNLLRDAPSLLQDRFHTELAKLKDWERFQTLASLQRIAEMMEVETLDASPILVAGPVDAPTAATSAETIPTEVTAESLALSDEQRHWAKPKSTRVKKEKER